MAISKTYKHDRVNEGSFIQFSRDMKFRPEKVTEIIEDSVRVVEKNYEEVLSVHMKQYGDSKIYSDIHIVIHKNLARLQELFNNFDDREDGKESYGPGMQL